MDSNFCLSKNSTFPDIQNIRDFRDCIRIMCVTQSRSVILSRRTVFQPISHLKDVCSSHF